MMSPAAAYSVRTSGIAGLGWLQVIWTTEADTAAGLQPSSHPVPALACQCLIDAATAAAVTGVPSENSTPGRRVIWKILLPAPT